MKKIFTIFFLLLIHVSYAQLFENNFNLFAYNATRLNVERATIYDPGPGDWQFAHAPSIAFFKGKLYAIFANGRIGEDEGEQRIVLSESSGFTTWTTPVPLASTTADYVLTPGGIYVANEDLMVVYYTRNDNAADLSRPNRVLLAKYTTDGISWSSEVNLGIPIFPSHRPTLLSNGRLILTGNRDFYYTSDVTGLSGWTKSGISAYNPGESANLVEGAIIEINDSVYTLFRDVGKKLLWQESSKDGVNWGVPKITAFTDNNSKSYLGRLPNGKYYYIGTPDTVSMGTRTPLVLSLSDDGFNYNQNYIIAADYYAKKYTAGRYKDGQFGYPYSMVHNGFLYVIASRMKEKMEVFRINLNDLNTQTPMPQKDLSLSPQLDGTMFPLDAGWIAGTITKAGSATLTPEGEMRINCAAGESYSFQATPTSSAVFNPTGDFTVEFRMKVVANNGRGIDIYLRDGVTAASLFCVTTDKVYFNSTPAKDLYALDGTSYHTYRLAVKRNENVMYLFIDGAFVTTISRSPNNASVQLLFGKSNAGAVTDAYLDYLAYDLTGAYQPSGASLPVEFGSLMADISQDRVNVRWETLTEQNCAYYDIELSKDGQHFIKVGRVNSKAENGFSDTRLDYEFTLPLNNVPALSISLFGFALAAGFIFKRRKILVPLSVLFVWCFVHFSCKKNNELDTADNAKLYLRIVQVDTDGTSKTSKTVVVVKK